MANVEEARKKFFEAKKAVESCRASISELQAKADLLQESLPKLKDGIVDAERVKTSALDAFALNSNKQAEAALKAARQAHEAAQKAYSESNELVEATNRALKKQEAELVRLSNALDLAKRECWQAVADEIKSAIPKHLFGDMKTLFIAGAQCSQTRQFILDTLFPNIPSEEFQTIRSELVEKYGIGE